MNIEVDVLMETLEQIIRIGRGQCIFNKTSLRLVEKTFRRADW